MTSAPRIVVVDASLALKWVLNEPDTPDALALLEEWQQGGILATAPSWFACEVGNILYREALGGTFTLDEAGELLSAALAQVHLHGETPADALRALAIARDAGQKSSYDAQYAALAERLDCDLWTADGKFAAAVRGVFQRVRLLSEAANARESYRDQVAALGRQMGERYSIIQRAAADQRSILDPDVRAPIVAACQELRAFFAQVRALEPPADLRSAHERLIEGIDRYDEVAGNRLAAAGLLDRGEFRQGLDIWKNAQSLEDEAHPLVAEAGRRIQTN